APPGTERVGHPPAGGEQSGVELHVLVHGDGPVAPVARGDETELPTAFFRGERALFVARREPAAFGHDPDLEEVHGLGLRGVVLAEREGVAAVEPADVRQTTLVRGTYGDHRPVPPSGAYTTGRRATPPRSRGDDVGGQRPTQAWFTQAARGGIAQR